MSAAQLDAALERELGASRYAWRLPRSPRPEAEAGIVTAFLRIVAETIRDGLKAAWQWIEKVLDWLRGDGHDSPSAPARKLSDIGTFLRGALYLVMGVLVSITAVLLWRACSERSALSKAASATVVRAAPDIEDEATGPEQLPENEWLSMAHDLGAKGEYRLALRALFLACLAHLSKRGLIQVARFKSNLEYRRELERHAHACPELLAPFSENVGIYEAVWYGAHEATHELLMRAAENQERLNVGEQHI